MADETSSNESAVAHSPACTGAALSLDALVAANYQTLYRYAYRLAGSAADAEDLTQQVFMVAQQRLDQVRQPDKVRSWLFSVLRNSYLKNRCRPAAIPMANLEFDADSIAQPVPAADDIDRQRLQQAIDDLPDAFKLVLMMYFLQRDFRKTAPADGHGYEPIVASQGTFASPAARSESIGAPIRLP